MVLTLASAAWGGPDETGDALDRLGEVLELRLGEGVITREEVLPALIVSVTPRYNPSEAWFPTRSIEVLSRAFGGNAGLRLCEACAAPRTWVEGGALVYQAGPLGLDELVRLDETARGTAAPARSAVWLDETRSGVSLRIVDLGSGRVIFAQNVDPLLQENQKTQRMGLMADELERRARGDSLTQTFVDAAVWPGQHVSLDFTDQWGKTNANLSGVTISLFDPVVGFGVCHHRRLPLLDTLVGAQVIVAMPTAVVNALGQEGDVLDPLVTAVGVVRVPFGRSNYGVVGTASTNGEFGLGLSLMNIRLLPVLP